MLRLEGIVRLWQSRLVVLSKGMELSGAKWIGSQGELRRVQERNGVAVTDWLVSEGFVMDGMERIGSVGQDRLSWTGSFW